MLILATCAAMSVPAAGQLSGSPPCGGERVYVHLDKQVYVTGEPINFKVYLINGAVPGTDPCSKILYFTLLDAGEKSGAEWRINIDDGPVSGSFLIPAEIEAGLYQLRVFTNLMRNGPSDCVYSQNVLIVSLSEAIPDTLILPFQGDTLAGHLPAFTQNGYTLKVTTSKDTYEANETVHMEIALSSLQQTDVTADLSVSVTAETPFRELIPETKMTSCLKAGIPRQDKKQVPCKYQAENKSFILTGRIRNRKDNTPLAHGKILLSVTDSISPKIIYASTDKAGEFHFYLGRIFDNQELILQFGDQSRNTDYYWEADKKTWIAGQWIVKPYGLNPEETAFLSVLKDLRLIEAVYAGKSTPEPAETVTSRPNYFNFPNQVVYPGDFADLVNFKEIADNILPGVKFAVHSHDFSLQLLNGKSGLWQENNTVLLNGVPYTDLAYIATLGTREIKRIEVMAENYLAGSITFPGLISIYTYDNAIPENYLKNNTFIFRNTVIPNDRETASRLKALTGEHDPDFRGTLFWDPRISITGKENRVIEFPASLLTGRYSIKIRGLTDHDIPLSTDAFFEVK